MGTSGRLGWVDQAKGIGILLIVLGHASYLFGPVSNVASYFKIAVFYVISGYLTCMKDAGGGSSPALARRTVAHKARTLLVPYLFYSSLALACILARGLVGGLGIGPVLGPLAHTLTLRGVSTLWFLPTLFFAFVLHEGVLLMVTRLGRSEGRLVMLVLMVAVPVACVGLSLSSLVVGDGGGPLVIVRDVVLVLAKSLVAWWFLEVGYTVAAETITLPVAVHGITLGGSVALAVALGSSSIDFNNLDFGVRPPLFFVLGVMCSLGLLGALRCIGFRTRHLEDVGRASLFVMCTHLPLPVLAVCARVVGLLVPRRGVVDAPYVIYCLLVVAMVMAVEMVLWWLWGRAKLALCKHRFLEFLKYC